MPFAGRPIAGGAQEKRAARVFERGCSDAVDQKQDCMLVFVDWFLFSEASDRFWRLLLLCRTLHILQGLRRRLDRP